MLSTGRTQLDLSALLTSLLAAAAHQSRFVQPAVSAEHAKAVVHFWEGMSGLRGRPLDELV